MKPSFTTLGCPDWDLDTVIQNGSAYGFSGVDFRGLQEEIDVTHLRPFTTGIAETKRRFADANLAVCGISTSLRICDETRVDSNLEEAKRTIPIAGELDVPLLRVFGGGIAEGKTKAEMADIGQSMMDQVLALDGANAFRWVLETHDLWISSEECRLLLDRVPDEAFGILWDVGHTARVGGEDPEASLAAFDHRVYYIHVKDAIHDTSHPEAMKDGWRYVEPGTGQLPLEEALSLMKDRSFDGYVTFEWEKRWHRELPDPEEMFPKFISWFNALDLYPKEQPQKNPDAHESTASFPERRVWSSNRCHACSSARLLCVLRTHLPLTRPPFLPFRV